MDDLLDQTLRRTAADNNALIRSGEARLVGWSRSMLYSGFNILPRSVFWSAYLNGRSDNLDVIHLRDICSKGQDGKIETASKTVPCLCSTSRSSRRINRAILYRWLVHGNHGSSSIRKHRENNYLLRSDQLGGILPFNAVLSRNKA